MSISLLEDEKQNQPTNVLPQTQTKWKEAMSIKKAR